MLRFFRRMRQNIINENKTGKYLKYAIGEIFLVVIGILIAVSINNWNENRIDRILEKEYLNRIRVDLSFDYAWINRYILDRYDRKIKGLKKGKAYFQGQYKVKDTLDFLRDVGYGGVFGNADLNLSQNSYNELISTGNLRKIENPKLRTTIINYYENSNALAKASKNYVSGYIDFTNSFTAFNTNDPNFIEEFDQKLFLKNIKTIDYYRLANKEFTLANRLLDWGTEVKTDAKELMNAIDLYLEE
jgi:Family of unknown function (DUF6090)